MSMTASTISYTSAAKSAQSKVFLVPWDPESIVHRQRLYDQRVACGWKKEKIEEWRRLQVEGKMAIHWVVSGPRHTSKDS